ncbi:MAG TPA: efflux RND transporter periplasmic adaptor subunit [Chitinophagaceae bacterium]|nr:efflux RND transporter periplasmic adaptor subunit [Chitinophagaceae bacterium]MCC6635698.1 efflux RND transporter periplasmic adaptor subunit [Chitinophagaceae bacterium]HMZ46163.1 efflux RND transporter periplasmic adaptor subunit [Chitinophagaceae bacterium]HNM33425.1 efflux RND transporter periplasmic adaptor subunit [Chitinophagaceae bacterium]HNN30348.1 efflux RND transporter periplasmic adaptor subunit [Chitinophagaceae bacterium]
MSKKMIWIIVGLVLAIIILIGLKKAGIIGKEEGLKVAIEKVSKRTIIETVTASGKISPEVEVKVSPDISGEIVELSVEEGDTVHRGQIVAKIYADIYASQRDQAAAGVDQSKAAEANANASLAALDATLQQAYANYIRQKKLYDEKVISKAEYEQAEQTYKTAQANYNAAKESIKGSKASIKSAQANLNRADKDISRTVITAPMNGVVNVLNVKKGERVAGNSFSIGTEMMRIADLNSMVAIVDVGENDIPKVSYGDTAIVSIDAYGSRKFYGIVFKIANPAASVTSTSSLNTEVANYKVHIRLLLDSYKDLIVKGKPFPFRPNMSATADIQTQTVKDVLSVPLAAVTTRDSKDNAIESKSKTKSSEESEEQDKTKTEEIEEVVFVKQADNKIKKIKVTTAIQDLNYIQITSGLKENDEIIVGPYSLLSKTLKEGDLVKVVPKEQLYEAKKQD